MSSNSVVGPGTANEPSAGARVADVGVFLRPSSGLLRDIGLGGAFGINAGAQSIGGAFAFYSLLLLLFPGANILLMLIIGGALITPLAWVYSQLAVSMPRSGGDYVYQSRIFHPATGVWAGTMHLFVWWSGLAALGSFWARSFLPFTFGVLATELHISFLNTLASDVATRLGTLVATTIILALGALITAAGAKVAARVAFCSVVAGVLSIGLILLELFLHSGHTVRHAFDAASGAKGTYALVLAEAHARGWHGGYTLSGTLAALPYAFLIFAGYWYTAFVAGEVKRPAQTHLMTTVVTVLASVVLLVLAWLGMQLHAGSAFTQAAYFLQNHAPAVYAKLTPVGASPQAFAVMVSDPVTKVLIAVGFLGWLLPLPIVFCMGASRVLFAMSFERLLPEWVARVSPRRHNPLAALLVTVVISEALLALIVYSDGFAQAFRNANLIALVLSTWACLAAVALPFRRRDLYDASPKVIRGSWLGLPPIVFVASTGLLFCGTGTYLALTQGRYSGGYTTVSVIALAVMLLSGPVLYVASRYVRGRQGIDLSLATRELPAE